MRETIRTFSGQIVGYYEVDPDGSKTVKDFSGRILGYYDADSDTTKLFGGVIIARGDVSGIFFKDKIHF